VQRESEYQREDKMIFEKSAISNGQSNARFIAPQPHEPAEKNLVEAAKCGQSTAFGLLCERYTQQLFRAAHRITRSQEDAEDAVQDALLRAYVHMRDFDGRSTFATWLTRIAINSALMILRKKRTSSELPIEGADEFGTAGLILEIADHAPNPERRYAHDEERAILNHAIQRLRPRLREVVQIQQLQERPMCEAAKAMGVSVAAAKARLFQAKIALRKSSLLRLMHQRRLGTGIRAFEPCANKRIPAPAM
jgi:RNA polymerase sigma-70 factor, ECF subfamily